MARRFAKVSEEEMKTAFFYPSDLVNTKTTAKLQNTRLLICMPLNKSSVYCILTRSSQNAAKFKQ